MNHGSVIVYYGNGKGKSSSAIGHAICAAGAGASVAIIQFLKGNNQKEIEFLKEVIPSGFFDNNRKVRNYYRMFYNCTGLTGDVVTNLLSNNLV